MKSWKVMLLSAESRSELFAEIAKLKKTAIRVEEATNIKNLAANPIKKTLILSTILVTTISCVVWLLFHKGEEPEKRTPPKQFKAPVTKGTKQNINIQESSTQRPNPVLIGSGTYTPTKNSQSITTITEDQANAFITNHPPKQPQILKSAMEHFINMAIPRNPGDDVPPIPIPEDFNSENESSAEIADIEKGLKNVIKAEENDNEELLWRKADIDAAKQEFKDLRAQGYRLKDYLEALQKKFNDDAFFLADAQKLVSEQFDNEDLTDEKYEELKSKVDKMLEDRGLPRTIDDRDIPIEKDEPQQEENKK